jgi:O-antigen/teichoic acid export membrane protein
VSARVTNRETIRGGTVIAVAMAVMNLTTYGFTILAARLLGPAEYGALAAAMGLLLVVNVLSLGLQATGARRVSAAPQDRRSIEIEVMRTTQVASLALGVVALAASPLILEVLNLDSWGPPLLIAVTAVPLTVMGGQAGILQGERRWAPLAWIYVAVGVGRIGFGVIALVVEPNTTGAMVGVALGAFVPVVIGWFALRHPSRRTVDQDTGPVVSVTQPGSRWARGGVLRETFHNSHALLAFFALSNSDVVIARSTLDEHQAGLYAGGLILTKAVLFLPQFVVVIAFPSMSSQGASRKMHLTSLGAVLAIGLVTVAGTAVLSAWAVTFIGGSKYAGLQGRLWAFAVLGTLLAMIQLLIYNIVARQRQRTVLLIWAAMVALLACTPFIDTLNQLLTTVLTIDTVLFLVLLARSLAPSYHRQPETPEPVVRS